MFEDTQELAENKLLLLYIFDNVQLPLSNTLITEIVLENNLLNYFQLQQYLSELVDSGFLTLEKENKKQLYNLTAAGKKVLQYFENRISNSKKEILKSYLKSRSEILKKEIEITADYFPDDDSNYIITCKIMENSSCIIELKLKVDSNDKAKQICSKWKSDPYKIYNLIMDKLTDQPC